MSTHHPRRPAGQPIPRAIDQSAHGVLQLTLGEPKSRRDQYGNVGDPVGKFWDRVCLDAVRVLLGFDCLFCADRPHGSASSLDRKKVA